jgi:pimeloyl-ACP methyl ester carboxylesterase
MPRVRVGSAELEYTESGSGDAVVFVHGSLNDRRAWGQQIEEFSRRYRVIAYTRRHHFGSEDLTAGGGPSVSAAADDLIALLEELSIAPAHIVGSSYGAFAALMAATRRPDLVQSLVLGEPPVGYMLSCEVESMSIWDDFLAEQYFPAKDLVASGKTEQGVKLFIDGVIGPGSFDRIPLQGRQTLLDNALSFATEAAPSDPFTRVEAEQITMPVLILNGELSPEFLRTISKRLAALLPHAKHLHVPAASHGMHSQNATAYNQMVLEFLGKC